MRTTHRDHPNYWAFVVHRVSGVLLALFLPVHFQVLYMGLNDAAEFDKFLTWTHVPIVKAAETVLILLLAAHLTGGLRLLAVEFLPWRDGQKTIVSITAGLSLVITLVYLLNGA